MKCFEKRTLAFLIPVVRQLQNIQQNKNWTISL